MPRDRRARMDKPAVTIPANRRTYSSQSPRSADNQNPQINGKSALEPQELDHRDDLGWRRMVHNFSPSWFSVTTGTGIVAVLLRTIPWQADWLYYLSIIFFVLNVGLFFSALAISVVRYALWPETWSLMLNDSTNSLFLATFTMGFATLIDMWVLVCVPAWGDWAAYVALGLWVFNAALGVLITAGLSIMLMSAGHQRSLDTITAAQLLPISATVVASGTGARVAAILPNPHIALGALIASYVMWGMAFPMSCSVLVMYYHRLALHKMPSREVIVSAFLPLSPTGLGGYAILYLGRVSRDLLPETDTIDPNAGSIAYVMGLFVALILWGWGLVWFILAIAAIYISRPIPFNMGWWGFTFPLGVYSISTIFIGMELPSRFFRVLGTVFATAVILLWILIAVGTVRGVRSGELFQSPSLACLKTSNREESARGDLADIRVDHGPGLEGEDDAKSAVSDAGVYSDV